MKNFTVISSNPNQKEGFVTKLFAETKVETPFGTKVKKETYYVSGTKQLVPNTQLQVDMNQFRIQEYGFVPDQSTGEAISLKWLHVK